MIQEKLEMKSRPTPIEAAKKMLVGLVEDLNSKSEIFFPHLESWLEALKKDKWMGIKAMLAVNAAVMVPTILQNWDVVEKLIQQ